MSEQTGGPRPRGGRGPRPERRQVLLRLDPTVYEALARWADDDLRSVNAHIEKLLRDSLAKAGRLPSGAGPLPRRGRPPRTPDDPTIDREVSGPRDQERPGTSGASAEPD